MTWRLHPNISGHGVQAAEQPSQLLRLQKNYATHAWALSLHVNLSGVQVAEPLKLRRVEERGNQVISRAPPV